MHFHDFHLDPRLQRAITDAGYKTPTPIQTQAIPVALQGSDLIGTAATGTGKTAAFVLPILNRLLHKTPAIRATRALIVTPTRELADQIQSVIRSLARHTPLRSAPVYGGVGHFPQKKSLTDGTEIIVCCPGRFLDHLSLGYLNLSQVETVVLDEADRMLDMGFLPDIKRILGVLPKQRQTLLFSATFDQELMKLVHQFLHEPKRVSVSVELPAETVDHCFYPVHSKLKTPLLIALLKTMTRESVLVFTRTKHRANRVREHLEKAGFKTGVLHSNKSQNARRIALDGFRSGKLEILVATDIVARGIDISTISHVINYDIPDTSTNYIHRIGRTGRAERSGDAITLICDEDMSEVREIERKLGKAVERRKLEGFDYHAPVEKGDPFARGPHPHHSRHPQSGAKHHGQAQQNQGSQSSHTSHKPHHSQNHSGHSSSNKWHYGKNNHKNRHR